MKKTIGAAAITTSLLLAACSHQENKNTIRVGTISGPETQLMQVAKQVAEQRYKLNVKIITFTDYSLPNRALSNGDIDANAFQHTAYLETVSKARGYHFATAGKTFIYPMGIYSQKIKHLNQLPDKAIVAIPNDPSNEGRALLLLQQAKLIKLRPGVSTTATPNDVVSNPKHLQFKELDAANLTRALPDVTIAAINTNYAILAGLSPSKNALIAESIHSPYANIIVIRQDEKNEKKVKELVEAYQSTPVLNKAKQLFHGNAIPAWKTKH